MQEIILIAVIVLLGFIWSSSLKAREMALFAVKRHCRRMDLQLLDDYVALNGLWPKRNKEGKVKAWRSYVFEFSSTGDDRYHGKIVMLGHQIEGIYLEPHRDPHQNHSIDYF